MRPFPEERLSHAQVERPSAPSPAPLPLPRLAYGVIEAAIATGLGKSTIAAAVRRGELPAVRQGKRVLILSHHLMEWVAEESAGGVPEPRPLP